MCDQKTTRTPEQQQARNERFVRYLVGQTMETGFTSAFAAGALMGQIVRVHFEEHHPNQIAEGLALYEESLAGREEDYREGFRRGYGFTDETREEGQS